MKEKKKEQNLMGGSLGYKKKRIKISFNEYQILRKRVDNQKYKMSSIFSIQLWKVSKDKKDSWAELTIPKLLKFNFQPTSDKLDHLVENHQRKLSWGESAKVKSDMSIFVSCA